MPAGNLYVTDISDNTISVYDPGASQPKRHDHGLNVPTSLAFDPPWQPLRGQRGSNSVSVFPPGSATAIATISGLNCANALAFDSSGNLYVATGTSVSVFGPALEAGGVVIRAGDSDLPINIGSGVLFQPRIDRDRRRARTDLHDHGRHADLRRLRTRRATSASATSARPTEHRHRHRPVADRARCDQPGISPSTSPASQTAVAIST